MNHLDVTSVWKSSKISPSCHFKGKHFKQFSWNMLQRLRKLIIGSSIWSINFKLKLQYASLRHESNEMEKSFVSLKWKTLSCSFFFLCILIFSIFFHKFYFSIQRHFRAAVLYIFIWIICLFNFLCFFWWIFWCHLILQMGTEVDGCICL